MPSAPDLDARPGLGERIGAAFGVDDPWERPRPQIERRDVVLVAVVAIIGLVSLELVRSFGQLDEYTDASPWLQRLAVFSGAVMLIGRRRWPLIVAITMAAHMILVGITMPLVMGQFTLQAAYFVAFLSAVAWAQDRKAMLTVVGIIVVVMFTWIALQFAIGQSTVEYMRQQGLEPGGWIPPIVADVILSTIINIIFFGGAIAGGQILWRDARQKAQLQRQAETIADQAEDLRDQAITEERLRIARELHDVVAHHVSVIGVQAAAARRVLDRNPSAATGALSTIESSSREAVTSMRGLLGTLRQIGSVPTESASREPEPSLDQVPALVESAQTPTRSVTYELVEPQAGAARRIPPPIAHSIYRTVQEALTNVAKHSTASEARVVVRIDADRYAEVEIIDNGRPHGSTSLGSGLGQLGIRERAASHRAEVEIGPRATGGYRVRVRYPLTTVQEDVA